MDKDLKISDDLKFDTRLINKNVRDGLIDEKEYEKHLSALPDEEQKANFLEVFEEEENFAEDLTFTSG